MNSYRVVRRLAAIAALVGAVSSAAVVPAVGIVGAAPHSAGPRAVACAVSYTVVRGDSWWAIKEKAGTSLSAVLNANNATQSTPLVVGRTVCLPAGSKVGTGATSASSESTCDVTYRAVRGDSWSRIARKKKVTLRELLAVNSATTRTKILIGDVLCLPASARSATQASTGLVLPPPARVFSAKRSRAIIREVFPTRLEGRALEIAQRESRMNAAAYNWCCVGLFQINWYSHSKWLGEMGVTAPEMLLDAEVNARAALALYKRAGGWGPWQ